MDKNIKKACLNELLFSGFVLGVLYSITTFWAYYMQPATTAEAWIFRFYGITVLALCQFRFGRRVAAMRDTDGAGYSYLQALGFSIKMALLAGLIFGFTKWLLLFVIDPTLGEILRQGTLEETLKIMPTSSDEAIETYKATINATTSVWGLMFQGMLALLLNGGFIALLSSAFIKRKTDIFAKND